MALYNKTQIAYTWPNLAAMAQASELDRSEPQQGGY
jgi:hypothetical protein